MTADCQSDPVTVDYLDTVPAKAHKTKTVEGRLCETLRKLAATEGNLHLFATLKRLGLSTNDVSSFVEKQLIHKKVVSHSDPKLRRVAMHSKLVDASAYAKRLRQEKNTWKQRIFKKYQGNKSKGKRVVDELLQKYKHQKLLEYEDADRKIKFYMDKSELNKSMKEIPKETSRFLNGVNIFSADQELVAEDPLGPFICHKSIKLTQDELNILSRGPKFMIRCDLSEEEHKIDVEKMIVKQKFDNCFNQCEDDSSVALNTSASVQNQNKPSAEKVFGVRSNRVKGENCNMDKLDNFDVKWEENCGSMPYDHRSKILDLGNMRATNYKYNKNICLPPNESPQVESAHESRRTELMRVFERVAKDPKFKDPGNESNLSPSELRGLRSLKKRIREGSIVIADTDKSKRLSLIHI